MASRLDLPRAASKIREGSIPRMHRFYHMEYFLLPDDMDPRKLDLVLFGPVAKLYLEAESKVRINDFYLQSYSSVIRVIA